MSPREVHLVTRATMSNPPDNRAAPAPGAAVPFDAQFSAELVETLRKRHRRLKPHEKLSIAGELGHGHTLVELRLASPDETFLLSLDVAVECAPNDLDNPLEARDVAVNYLDVVLEDFLANDRHLGVLPEWDVHDVEGMQVKVRGEVINPKLESQADRLLREHGFASDGTLADES